MTALEQMLVYYHEKPGRTAEMLDGWQDSDQRSSYEVLASRLGDLPHDCHILDLACGDGVLLQLLQHAGFSLIEGLDRSTQELAAARERLGPGVHLHCEDARFTTLPSDSFDVVLCHMALMLMPSVERVLAEVARICKPGGLVLAVLNRPLRDRTFEFFRSQVHSAAKDAGMERLQMGDPRTMSREGLLELMSTEDFDPQSVRIEDFELHFEGPARRLWSKLRLTYDVARLPLDSQERLEQQTLTRWHSLFSKQEQLSCSMGIRLVQARTKINPNEGLLDAPRTHLGHWQRTGETHDRLQGAWIRRNSSSKSILKRSNILGPSLTMEGARDKVSLACIGSQSCVSRGDSAAESDRPGEPAHSSALGIATQVAPPTGEVIMNNETVNHGTTNEHLLQDFVQTSASCGAYDPGPDPTWDPSEFPMAESFMEEVETTVAEEVEVLTSEPGEPPEDNT